MLRQVGPEVPTLSRNNAATVRYPLGGGRRGRIFGLVNTRLAAGASLTIVLIVIAAVLRTAVAAEPTATTTVSGSQSADDATITTAAGVQGLSTARAALRLPVKIRGTVTYVANLPNILFVQDETGGVCVLGPRDPAVRKALKAGARVEVEGVTSPGRLVPCVVARGREPIAITASDERPSPASPRVVTLADLTSPRRHGELVEARGVVRSVRTESLGANTQQDALVLTVASGGARVEAAYLAWPAATPVPTQWVGATVRLRGVFNSAVPDKQQVAGMRLLLNLRTDVQVVAAAATTAGMDATPAADVASAADEADPRRIKLRGAVTLVSAGKGMYVQDATGGVWVDAADRPAMSAAGSLKVGDGLEVIGFPVRRSGAALVEDAAYTVTGPAKLPDAPQVTADEALAGGHDGRLVSVDALVLEVSRLTEGPTLVLQSGERVFLARLADAGPADSPAAAGSLAGVSENSWVRATGVCVNNRLPDRPAAADARPVSFHLLLPSAGAIRIVRAPNWWTLEKVLIGTGALLLLALAALAWVIALRRRVAEQTTQIRTHLGRHTLNEERMRIARELHDSLEQDLLGITMQLKATAKLLDRPDRARESLTLASAMVRRSQAETHRAVWDLRERKAGQEGLIPTLRSALAGLTAGAGAGGEGPAIEVTVDGAEPPLSPQTENHLLRIALEAVTNAFKHAAATAVKVSVAFPPGRVRLEVSDDGKGFDADHPPPPISGHFGLFGMGERAEKLGGKLTVKSRPGEGTVVLLDAPIPST